MADFNMADMFGQLSEMQRKMQEAQAQAAAQSVTAEVGGGMVRVTANGTPRITAIQSTGRRSATTPNCSKTS